jgi:AbrB family looped-hinge helix DNA binding protein
MKAYLTVDKAGRIVIPKPLRDELGLEPGDPLQLEGEHDRIVLRPVRESIPIRKEDGVWVYRSGRPATGVSIRALLVQDREGR